MNDGLFHCFIGQGGALLNKKKNQGLQDMLGALFCTLNIYCEKFGFAKIRHLL